MPLITEITAFIMGASAGAAAIFFTLRRSTQRALREHEALTARYTAREQDLRAATTEIEKLRAEAERVTDASAHAQSRATALTAILDGITLPVWQRDGALAIIYRNAAYARAVEEDPESATPPIELHKQSRVLAENAKRDGVAKQERRHIVIGGQRRWFEITEIPMQDGGLLGFARDLTEIDTLREEVDRYASAQSDLLESSRNAMAIYGKDIRLASYNAAFSNLWKLDDAWLNGKPSYGEVLEVLREKRKLPEQANFPLFKQQQIKLFQSLIDPQEEFFFLPDGKTLRVIAIPHALGGILFSYEDVTDRLALERSYNTLIAVQRETLNKLHEGVAVFGEDGRLKLCNPVYRKIWNLPEQLTQQEPHFSDILEHIRPFFMDLEWEKFRNQMAMHSQVRVFNYQRLERVDGSVIDWSSVPLPDGATLFTFIDMTDSTLLERSLREKNEALQAADRIKTQFLANVSYELRSPLTSISGFAEMLKQDYFGKLSEKQREYVEGIHLSAQQLMHLIDNILDLASIQAGYMQLNVSHCDMHGLLSNVLHLVDGRAKEMGIRLTFRCPATVGNILADETRLKQVLFNLLVNALNYTPEGGMIELGAAAEGEDVRLWVKDNGVGIAPSEQQAVFSTFYRGGATGGPQRPGTGLGLPMVKSFVELHGGRVTLDSDLGVGTTITCFLPRRNPALEQYISTA